MMLERMMGMDHYFRDDGIAFVECRVDGYRGIYGSGSTVADAVLSVVRRLRRLGLDAIPGSFTYAWRESRVRRGTGDYRERAR